MTAAQEGGASDWRIPCAERRNEIERVSKASKKDILRDEGMYVGLPSSCCTNT